MRGHIYFVTGGVRSGKSRRAQELASQKDSEVVYIATYATDLLDTEMEARIDAHKLSRPGNWKTIENRFDLTNLISEFYHLPILIDCLTLWISYWQTRDETKILVELEAALQCAGKNGVTLFIVSNELGMGLVPAHAESRAFRDLCGLANQLVARYADTVEFMIAGIPLKLKGS